MYQSPRTVTELFDRGIGCGQRPPIVTEVWSWSLAGVFVVSDALAVSDQNARPNGSLDALTRATNKIETTKEHEAAKICAHNFKRTPPRQPTRNIQHTIMKTFTLINLLATIYAASCSPPSSAAPLAQHESKGHAARLDRAWQSLSTNFSPLRDLYDDDAILKFCWGSANPDCAEGSVDEILLPFHQALEKFQCELRVLTGSENSEVLSIGWNNYQETPDGCSQVTTGIAVFEFNDEDKVIRHYSLSDDEVYCVPNYLASIAAGLTEE
jgi:hypothetical protein